MDCCEKRNVKILTILNSFSTLKMESNRGLYFMNIVVLIISMLLFFVLFFGIGFLLNMLLRMSWIMAILYPIITIFIIDDVRFIEYFRNSGTAFRELGSKIASLAPADIAIL